jgi:hypothetical protein
VDILTGIQEDHGMDLIAIVQHPLTAIGVAGFIVLQCIQLGRWTAGQADLSWWRTSVEEAAAVYMRATGKDVTRLERMDVDQIAAAVGCRRDVAETCLREIARQAAKSSIASSR